MFGGRMRSRGGAPARNVLFRAAQRKRTERGSAREIEGDWGELPDRA